MATKKMATRAVAALALLAPFSLAKQLESNIIPGAYLVEFETPAVLGARSLDSQTFFTNLSDSRIVAEPRLSLNYELFNGASFSLDTEDDHQGTIDTIQSFQIVKKVYPVRTYYQPATNPVTLEDVEIQTSFSRNAHMKRSTDNGQNTHVMTGVDKLHEAGFTGEGMFVAILDGGIDYTHSALGGCFGPGCKVAAGTDLVGDGWDGRSISTAVPDDDPMDCDGHGTVIAGIVGANPNIYNFTGVVPNATLGIWRIAGCAGHSSSDVIIKALNLAYEAKADVISISFGGINGWADEPASLAVERITSKGIPCIVAAGNQGESGAFLTDSPSDGDGAISVGNIQNTVIPRIFKGAMYTLGNEDPVDFVYAGGVENGKFGNSTIPLYPLTLNTTVMDDGCSALPDNIPDLTNYVVLIRRGTCRPKFKVENAVAKGAKRILIYNNVNDEIYSPSVDFPTVSVGMITADLGVKFVKALQANTSINIVFQGNKLVYSVIPNRLNPGKMATDSSWGPTWGLKVKPQISAPGGDILSTWLRAEGGYAVFSGTSMATPFIAGVVVLIKQIRGKNSMSPLELSSLLASTASPVEFNDGKVIADYLAPVVQQGGGLVNAYKAAYINTFLDVDVVALNDSWYFKSNHPITIKNTGSEAQKYAFSNIVAATAYTLSPGGIVPDPFPPTLVTDSTSGATIRFEPPLLTVEAGSTGILNMYFTPPKGLDPSRIPIYSGYVAINGSAGDTLTLPYAGVASRMKDAKIFDTATGYPFLTTNVNMTEPITGDDQVFTIPRNANRTSPLDGNSSYPTIALSLAMGSHLVRLDILPQNSTDLPLVLIAGQYVLGAMPETPAERISRRSLEEFIWDGFLSDNNKAPAGRYKVLVRALKLTGDAAEDGDYEAWKSPSFEIKYT